MAKVTGKSVLAGISGKLGEELIFKIRNGKTYVSRKPQISPKKTKARKEQQVKFTKAVAFAKQALNDPKLLSEIKKNKPSKYSTLYNTAISYYFRYVAV